jgi:hypothetical protein
MGPKSTVLTVALYTYDNQHNTVYESDLLILTKTHSDRDS